MRKVQRGFILKVTLEGAERRFCLQDLRSGERRTFASWEALREHLERVPRPGLR